MPETRATAEAVEPYKISEIFSIVPEYDGNSIFLNTFITSCTTAQSMAVGNQSTLLVLHIKNKLRGRAAELVNSRNPSSWDEIRNLLESHFGDPRDLSSLIQDLQRMRQLPNESPLTFAARLQTHEAKMHAAVNKQNLTTKEKSAQISLIDSMALNSLLTGVEPRIGQILRASDPDDIVTAVSRIKRELQLNHFETQKSSNSRNNLPPMRKPPIPIKQCSFCRRLGHSYNECLSRQRQLQNNGNYSQNFRPNPFSQPQTSQSRNPNYPQQNRFPQQGTSQQQHRASTSVVVAPHNNNRPANFFKQQRAHHFNQTDYYNSLDYDDYDSGYETTERNFQGSFQNEQPYDDNSYYDFNTPPTTTPDYYDFDYTQNSCQQSQNFQPSPPQTAPPDVQEIQTQIQTLNLEENFNPNLNFPEQNFL